MGGGLFGGVLPFNDRWGPVDAAAGMHSSGWPSLGMGDPQGARANVPVPTMSYAPAPTLPPPVDVPPQIAGPQMASAPQPQMPSPHMGSPGFMDRLGRGINDNSMALMMFSAGLMGGEGFAGAGRMALAGSALDRKNRSESQQQAAIRAALAGKVPPNMVEAAVANPEIAKLVLQRLYPERAFSFHNVDGALVAADPSKGTAQTIIPSTKAPDTVEVDPDKPRMQWNPTARKYEPLSGVPTPEQTNPYSLGAKATEGQQNSALFANRLHDAERVLREIKVEEAAQSIWQRGLSGASELYNFNSPEYQKLDQAKRNFINATLRRESGAAIQKSEFDNADRQYFPMPGDAPEVLAQKRRNRMDAIKGISGGAGPRYKPPYSFDPSGEITGDTNAPKRRIKIDATGKVLP